MLATRVCPRLGPPDTSWAPGLLVPPAVSSAVSPSHSDIYTGLPWLRSEDDHMLCLESVGKARLWLASPPVEAGRPATFSEVAPWQPLVTWKHAVSRDDDPSLWVFQVSAFPVDSGWRSGGQAGAPFSGGPSERLAGTCSLWVTSWCCPHHGIRAHGVVPATQVCGCEMYMLNGNCTELHAVDSTRAAVPSVLCLFLIKTIFFCFPINLLHVSKYIRTLPLVKSGFE